MRRNLTLCAIGLVLTAGLITLIGAPRSDPPKQQSEPEAVETPFPFSYKFPDVQDPAWFDAQIGSPSQHERTTDCRPPCSVVNITCGGPLPAGSAGAMSPVDCNMYLSAESCGLLGVQSGPIAMDLLTGIVATPPSVTTAEDAYSFCAARHEIVHAGQDTCENPPCKLEADAYGDTLECLLEIKDQICGAEPTGTECINIRLQICSTAGAFGMMTCRTEGDSCRACSDCVDNCSSQSGICLNTLFPEGAPSGSSDGVGATCDNARCLYCGGAGCPPTPEPSPTPDATPTPEPTPTLPPSPTPPPPPLPPSTPPCADMRPNLPAQPQNLPRSASRRSRGETSSNSTPCNACGCGVDPTTGGCRMDCL